MASRESGIVISTAPVVKPKGLIDAISEIEQFYVAESEGSEIPDRFFTIKNKIEFFEVGFKGSFISGLITVLLTPLAIGVIENMIPVFGSNTPSTYDKLFVFSIALFFTIGYSFFIDMIGRYYSGRVTISMIRSFVNGLITGAVLKLILAFIFYHFIYLVVLKEERVASFLLSIHSRFKGDYINDVYSWVLNFKPVFLTSAYFIALTTALFILIPLSSIAAGSINNKRNKEGFHG